MSDPAVEGRLLGRYLAGDKFYDVLGDVDETFVFAWGYLGSSPQGVTPGASAAQASDRIDDKVKRGYVWAKGFSCFTPEGLARHRLAHLDQSLPDDSTQPPAGKPRL